jgi:hypothetical protein
MLPPLVPAKYAFYLFKQLRNELNEPKKNNNHAGQAQHMGLFLPICLLQKYVEDGNQDPDTGYAVDQA